MSTKAGNNLAKFVDQLSNNSHLRIEKNLGDGYYRLRATEAQRRQAAQDIRCSEDIVIEMLRNSRDADAKNIFIATNTSKRLRSILVIDDGFGIPKNLHDIIFDPYVTSKLDSMTQDKWGVHGRGMALYSIKENCDKAYVVKSSPGIGSSIFVLSNTIDISEKVDQSTFPDFFIDKNNLLTVRGPKNIIRTICEFSIENRKSVNVYCGSFAEIAATMYKLNLTNAKIGAFDTPNKETKIIDMLKYASDPNDFCSIAKKLGITMSSRTARRIMNSEIKPLKTVIEEIVNHGIKKATSTNLGNAQNNNFEFDINDIKLITNEPAKPFKLKLQESDKSVIADGIIQNFKPIADKYYLDSNIIPTITVNRDKISISFDVKESNS